MKPEMVGMSSARLARLDEVMKRRYVGALENQAQNPRFVFSEKVEQVNTSNHYSAKSPTPAVISGTSLPGTLADSRRTRYEAAFT